MRFFAGLALAGATLTATVVGDASMELTQANFDDVVIKSGKFTFVKFLAPW